MSIYTFYTTSNGQLGKLVKQGLIRELFQRNQITQAQFERLMQIQRA